LKDGDVAEQGSHEELLAKHGLYYQMWLAQQETTAPLRETEESSSKQDELPPSDGTVQAK
jgi:ABC transporter ATM